MPQVAIDIFRKVAALNNDKKYRCGNIIYLPSKGRLIISGDLHGNKWAYEQIVAAADLANNPDTHIIFQEIIHGGPQDCSGGCLSFELLLKAAQLKVQYPDNVHFLMGNHDLSAIKDSEVLRGGKEMTSCFNSGIYNKYKDKSDMVLLAMRQMLFSQALAAKTQSGIFISHSLPADRYADIFDAEVLERPLKMDDINRPSSGYLLLWGRNQSSQWLQELSEQLKINLFVAGHQRQEQGYKIVEPNMLILACDHNNGCIADLDLSEQYDMDKLHGSIKRLYDIA